MENLYDWKCRYHKFKQEAARKAKREGNSKEDRNAL